MTWTKERERQHSIPDWHRSWVPGGDIRGLSIPSIKKLTFGFTWFSESMPLILDLLKPLPQEVTTWTRPLQYLSAQDGAPMLASRLDQGVILNFAFVSPPMAKRSPLLHCVVQHPFLVYYLVNVPLHKFHVFCLLCRWTRKSLFSFS